MSLCQDHQNNFYFGTDGGYVIFNPSTNLFNYVNEGVNTPGIYCDKKNNMWFGFWGGGMKMIATDGTKKYYRHNETDSLSNPDEFCAAFGEDDSGRIIFLTYKNGVELFNPVTEKFTVFVHDKNNPASISHNTTGGYCKSRNGVEWFPTVGGGLNAFDPATKKFVSFKQADGLASDYIWSIAEDAKGNLWLGTMNGLCKFTPPQNIFYRDNSDAGSKPIIRNYSVTNGLPSNVFIYHAAYFDAGDNTMYFGSGSGLVTFNPDSITDNKFVPPVYITEIKWTDSENKNFIFRGNDSSGLKLSYNQNSVLFSFTALNFIHPEKNKYAYQLQDFDKDWIYTDASKRFANYTNLNPGNYIFKVKGSNNDGIWNEKFASVVFIIAPPYWQTWWFRMLVGTTLAVALYLIYRYRMQQILQLQSIRNKIAEDLHDDVGSTLNSISVFSEVAKIEAGKPIPALDDIGNSARKVVESMSDIVWTINPENDSFDKVIIRMRSFAYQLLNAKKIEFIFKADEGLNHIVLNMQVRKNFYLFFKEAVNNLAKYSLAKRASIHLHLNNKEIKMIIRDDGIGFDSENPLPGNGLKNMRSRANEMHAQMTITSAHEQGTSIELIVNC